MSNKCLDRGRQNKKSFRMTETSFVDFIKYANSNKIWILTLLKEQTLEMFLEIFWLLCNSRSQLVAYGNPAGLFLNPNYRFLNENEVLWMNLNSRLTLSNILITVLPRDSLLFNEKTDCNYYSDFQLLVVDSASEIGR